MSEPTASPVRRSLDRQRQEGAWLPHLLVVDVMLPDGDGGDITELLRDAWPGIPVVFVSAASRERLAELAPTGPVVAKPFDIDAFHSAVLSAVEAPRALRPVP